MNGLKLKSVGQSDQTILLSNLYIQCIAHGLQAILSKAVQKNETTNYPSTLKESFAKNRGNPKDNKVLTRSQIYLY